MNGKCRYCDEIIKAGSRVCQGEKCRKQMKTDEVTRRRRLARKKVAAAKAAEPKRYCEFCGKDISTLYRWAKRCGAKECKEKLRRQEYYARRDLRPKRVRVCEGCGKEFHPHGGQKYCDPDCVPNRPKKPYVRLAYNKQPEMEAYVAKTEDWTHEKYKAQEKANKKKKRVCMGEDCDNLTDGVNYYCDKCRASNFERAGGMLDGAEHSAPRQTFRGVK